MRITLISPRLAVQKGDFLGSGVPYWPLELATFAAFLRDRKESVSVIDLFGSDPSRLSDASDHYLQGMPLRAYLEQPSISKAEAFILYAISYMSHRELLEIVRLLKAINPKIPIAILENSQAVTAYSLQRMSSAFFEAGADMLICGEPYFNWSEIRGYLVEPQETGVPANVLCPAITRQPERITQRGMRYPVPAWELFNLKGYWSIPYSHGPKTATFLPILTSRGCPYPCDFCVVPETNNKRWRGNDPEAVVEEILTLRDRFGVHDFQIEDLNPTVQHARWEEVCRLLIAQNANIRFYFVSGTKAETVRIDQVPLFAAAGCRYISISPESGSKRLMKVIGKRFDHDHGLELVATCRKHGIRTQACLLVGHPSETEEDASTTQAYLRALVREGLDEVAVFIVAPFAGSSLYAQDTIDVGNDKALVSFSPKGRVGADTLEKRRRALIRIFFLEKLRRGVDLWAQGLRAVLGIPQTKMENLPRRVFYVLWLVTKARFAALWHHKYE